MDADKLVSLATVMALTRAWVVPLKDTTDCQAMREQLEVLRECCIYYFRQFCQSDRNRNDRERQVVLRLVANVALTMQCLIDLGPENDHWQEKPVLLETAMPQSSTSARGDAHLGLGPFIMANVPKSIWEMKRGEFRASRHLLNILIQVLTLRILNGIQRLELSFPVSPCWLCFSLVWKLVSLALRSMPKKRVRWHFECARHLPSGAGFGLQT